MNTISIITHDTFYKVYFQLEFSNKPLFNIHWVSGNKI